MKNGFYAIEIGKKDALVIISKWNQILRGNIQRRCISKNLIRKNILDKYKVHNENFIHYFFCYKLNDLPVSKTFFFFK